MSSGAGRDVLKGPFGRSVMLCSPHDHAPAQPPRLPQSLDAAGPSRAAGSLACDRARAGAREVPVARARAGADGEPRAGRACASARVHRGGARGLAQGRHGAARCRHHHVARHVRGGAARGRRRVPCGRRGDGAQGRQRLRRDAPARPSCRDRDADGLLPLQQRGGSGAPCAEAAWCRACRDRRFRRASRQWQPGHFLERRDRDVLLDAPDAALSRHRRGVGARRAEHHRECAAASRRRRRAIPRGDGDDDPAAARKLRPGSRDYLGGLRRAHARSACQPEFRRGRTTPGSRRS